MSAIRLYRRAYLVINLVFYGLVILGAVAVILFPEVQQLLLQRLRQELTHGRMKAVADAYRDGKVLTAIPLTFLVNLLAGAFGSITLPSLIVPYSGLLMGCYRASV